MMAKHGNLSINSDNIFPIIKKWMYSDKDIFVRELVSNGSDAITKLKKLGMAGEYELPEDYAGKIVVEVNDKDRTLKFTDNGLGMTGEEVEEFITQIAFSGATSFLEKYKDKADTDQIIGHFGLGFYSAFMVANEVHIDTLSWQKDALPVHWECDGSTEYDMEEGNRTEVGTTVTLFLNEDSLEYSNEYQVRETLNKYCSFMPYEIYLEKAGAAPKMKKDQDGNEVPEEPKPVNDIHPLWAKHPNECTEEEYKAFYRKVFNDYKEPLFWIHLNMDYPFNLKGILYFPRINMEYDAIEGVIKLYNNQVFIADNIKEVIPEYLMLLKGVIDCPDLPLNVSRSALQNDGFVKKISDYISKKVADKLSGMCKTSREEYEKYWNDIQPFIKYGCLKDAKFSEKMMDHILYETTEGAFLTLADLVPKKEETNAEEPEAEAAAEGSEEGNAAAENAPEENAGEAKEQEETEEEKEAKKTKIYYVTDPVAQGQYVSLFKEQNKTAVLMKHNIDISFIRHVEEKKEDLRFLRIDSQVDEDLKSEDAAEEEKKELAEIFRKAVGNDKLEVNASVLKNENTAAMMVLSEEDRRMLDMMKAYGMNEKEMAEYAAKPTLVLNSRHPLVQYILEHKKSRNGALVARQLHDMALMSYRPLTPEEMAAFVERSNEIMLKILK